MQMVPNLLSTNGDEKSAKLEAEPSYDTVEVHYMMPNLESANTNSKQCNVLDKSPSKVRSLYTYIDSGCCYNYSTAQFN